MQNLSPNFSNKILQALEAAAQKTPFFQSLYHQISEHYIQWIHANPQAVGLEIFQKGPCTYLFIKAPATYELLNSFALSPETVAANYVEEQTQYMQILMPHVMLSLEGQAGLVKMHKTLEKEQNSVTFFSLNEKQWLLLLSGPAQESSLTRIVQCLDSLGLIVHSTTSFPEEQTLLIQLSSEPQNLTYSSLQNVRVLLSKLVADCLIQNIECDHLARLLILKGLSLKQVTILAAQLAYLIQLQFPLSRDLMQDSLLAYPDLALLCIQLFEVRFDYKVLAEHRDLQMKRIENDLLSKLTLVSSVAADKLFRKLIQLIKATVRTNYYQVTQAGLDKDYISFKVQPHLLTDLKPPIMMAEIFVYHTLVEGVHLRSSLVARGGIRWSDRPEDYRTEVQGLVKAQQVKNTLIVPSGAKGGFYLKDKSFAQKSREEQQTIGRAGYRIFISGLLDLTDCQPHLPCPPQTLCYDARDPYLVVAADKGTATFSDLANQISQEYQHWLKDAFASGGSQGYDHKKIGITAKGAFLSAAHHMRNLNLPQKGTMVGIGDLSGDVFGNGVTLWPDLHLVAAFNHQHIFIDPNPTAEAFEERVRMTKLDKSSWLDYDRTKISQGGGIFERAQKNITLTPQIQKLLATEKEILPPEEILKALLCLKVDILFNGGIGTYVKASTERHSDVSDKANDAIRVDSTQLQCRMIVEGGNMGVTQKGRIEFSQLGGKINTDTVDNSGGVDCSDHEVNLKIFIDDLQTKGLFTEDRSAFLSRATNDVAQCVLEHNQNQNQTISFMEYVAVRDRFLHKKILQSLVDKGMLNCEVEGFPPMNELTSRIQNGQGLSRPELIVLFAYVKMDLKKQLLDQPSSRVFCTETFLSKAFPSKAIEKYRSFLPQHPLAWEIAITHLINFCTQITGISFYFRLTQETQAPLMTLVQSSLCAMDLFQIPKAVEALESQKDLTFTQRYEAMLQLYRLLFRCTKWLALNTPENLPNASVIAKRIALYPMAQSENTAYQKSLVSMRLFPALGLTLYCQDSQCDATLFQSFEYLRELFQAEEVERKIEALPARDAFEAQMRSWLREDFLKSLQILASKLPTEKKFALEKLQDFLKQWQKDVQTLLQTPDAEAPQIFVIVRFLERYAHNLVQS